jgi:hypothetical protein
VPEHDYAFAVTPTNPSPGRFLEPRAGAFSLAHSLPMTKSPHQSPEVVMPSHHLLVYLLIKEKNVCNDLEIHPEEEKARGAV